MTNLTQWLAAQRALCEAATQPGPWIVCASKDIGKNWLIGTGREDADGNYYGVTTDGVHASELQQSGSKADADFIANWSPDRAARVLAQVEQAVRALGALEQVAKANWKDIITRQELIVAESIADTCRDFAANLRAALTALLEAP